MAISLGFHILFAVAGMAMPVLLLTAELAWQRTRDPEWIELAVRWAKGTAILFAVGAVSGTVLSFELGLLWPGFMEHGALIGVPFTLEGFAFFFEAIFLGVYLYGRERISPGMRVFSVAAIAASGLASGVFVMAVNAFMQSPAGIDDPDPWIAFRSPAFPYQAVHMALAAYLSVAFLLAGIHAAGLLRSPGSALHRKALKIALAFAIPLAPLQLVSGDLSAKYVADDQPIKFAAMEAHFRTAERAPLHVGGLPDVEARELRGALPLPGFLSFLAHGDFESEVLGLEEFPEELWPNVTFVHVAFEVMVVAGGAMVLASLVAAFLWIRRRRAPENRWFLRALVLLAPAGLIATEAGWMVAEVGRQPWIIRGVLRTADAVTTNEGVIYPLVGFSLLYVLLGVSVVVLLRRHVFAAEEGR